MSIEAFEEKAEEYMIQYKIVTVYALSVFNPHLFVPPALIYCPSEFDDNIAE